MTTYSCPDYDVELIVEPKDRKRLDAHAFNVLVKFGKSEKRVRGMLMLHGLDAVSSMPIRGEGWLWVDRKADLPVQTDVVVKVTQTIPDPMYGGLDEVVRFKNILLKGKITRNYRIGQPGSGDVIQGGV